MAGPQITTKWKAAIWKLRPHQTVTDKGHIMTRRRWKHSWKISNVEIIRNHSACQNKKIKASHLIEITLYARVGLGNERAADGWHYQKPPKRSVGCHRTIKNNEVNIVLQMEERRLIQNPKSRQESRSRTTVEIWRVEDGKVAGKSAISISFEIIQHSKPSHFRKNRFHSNIWISTPALKKTVEHHFLNSLNIQIWILIFWIHFT